MGRFILVAAISLGFIFWAANQPSQGVSPRVATVIEQHTNVETALAEALKAEALADQAQAEAQKAVADAFKADTMADALMGTQLFVVAVLGLVLAGVIVYVMRR